MIAIPPQKKPANSCWGAILQIVMGFVHGQAKYDGKQSAQRGQADYLENTPDSGEPVHGTGRNEPVPRQRIRTRHRQSGRNDAGNQAGIINYADADDFHGEKGSGQRSAEQCGKNSAHAAHDEDMLILFIQVKQAADLRADGASQLQGCALPPGGTAAEMGDDGADKNERGQGKWDSFLASDGIQNLVCAEIFRCFTKMIQSDNDQTAYGQQV